MAHILTAMPDIGKTPRLAVAGRLGGALEDDVLYAATT